MDSTREYPKYQYSVFLRNSRDEQIVIRTETFEDLLEAKREINKILDKVETKTQDEESNGEKCVKCGAPAIRKKGISVKTNKPYEGIFCSTEDKTHVTWL